MSRLHLSSKSLPGVKEDMDIPDEPRDGVRWEGNLSNNLVQKWKDFFVLSSNNLSSIK